MDRGVGSKMTAHEPLDLLDVGGTDADGKVNGGSDSVSLDCQLGAANVPDGSPFRGKRRVLEQSDGGWHSVPQIDSQNDRNEILLVSMYSDKSCCTQFLLQLFYACH
jgi:hypothetical protein